MSALATVEPETILTKTERVLSLVGTTDTAAGFLGIDDGEPATTTLVLDIGSFVDMGMPEKVTVAVVPGDRLNG